MKQYFFLMLLVFLCNIANGQGFFKKIRSSLNSSIEGTVKNSHLKLNDPQKNLLITQIKKTNTESTKLLIESQVYELNFLLPINKAITKMQKPSIILVNFSAPSLIEESFSTQCKNIQTTILLNIVENWKSVLIFKERLVELSKKQPKNEFQEKIQANVIEVIQKINLIGSNINISDIDDQINYESQISRRKYLKNIKNYSQALVELNGLLEKMGAIMQQRDANQLTDLNEIIK